MSYNHFVGLRYDERHLSAGLRFDELQSLCWLEV